MSATILSFPERHYRPNLPKLFKLLDGIKDDPNELLAVAAMSLALAAKLRKGGHDSPREYQQAVDAIAMSALALLTILGVPREEVEDALPPAE